MAHLLEWGEVASNKIQWEDSPRREPWNRSQQMDQEIGNSALTLARYMMKKSLQKEQSICLSRYKMKQK